MYGRQQRTEVTSVTTVAERVTAVVAPVVDALELQLYDVEHQGTAVRVLVDRPGGVDLDTITEATRRISRALDDADPIEGRYTLEVSSPGLERPLRTPAHFAGAVGTTVNVKTRPGTEGERRVAGVIEDADDAGVTIRLDGGDTRGLRYEEIERARTVFAWGPAPRPGKKEHSR
jgi:ribosome maturation factor RimP